LFEVCNVAVTCTSLVSLLFYWYLDIESVNTACLTVYSCIWERDDLYMLTIYLDWHGRYLIYVVCLCLS